MSTRPEPTCFCLDIPENKCKVCHAVQLTWNVRTWILPGSTVYTLCSCATTTGESELNEPENETTALTETHSPFFLLLVSSSSQSLIPFLLQLLFRSAHPLHLASSLNQSPPTALTHTHTHTHTGHQCLGWGRIK